MACFRRLLLGMQWYRLTGMSFMIEWWYFVLVAEELHIPPEHSGSLWFSLGSCCVIVFCGLWTIVRLFVPSFGPCIVCSSVYDYPYKYVLYMSVYGSSVNCLYITSILMYETHIYEISRRHVYRVLEIYIK